MLKNCVIWNKGANKIFKKNPPTPPFLKGGFHRNPSLQKGFTLFEVLVAVSILAISGVTAMQVISQTLKNISKTKDYSFAVIAARNELDKLVLRDDIKGEQSGELEKENYKVKYTVTKIEAEKEAENTEGEEAASDPFFDRYEFAVTVSGKDSPANRAFTLKTLKLIKKGSGEEKD